jgi:uncharacterized protein YbcC (UPF0753/DUF2309 family)
VSAVQLQDRSPALDESRAALLAAITGACARIAPLWPLKHFVAVNPFLGFTAQPFEAACARLRRIAGADMLMPRAFYRDALAQGVIADVDLAQAAGGQEAGAALRRAAAREPTGDRPAAAVATVAEVLDRLAADGRRASLSAFMVDEISRWCAAYFDEGQSVWRMPARDQGLYAAWRAAMRYDRNPEVMGVRGFRAAVARAPADPVEAIGAAIQALGVPACAWEDYLHRALFDIGGWAAYARRRTWPAAPGGEDILVQLLAVRVVWGQALFAARQDAAFARAWGEAMAAAAEAPRDDASGDPDLAVDLALQQAYEAAAQRRLLARLSERPAASPKAARRPLQAAFCIDVRSEVYRRALEAACPEAETLGFAGFFGFPIEYVPIGRTHGGAQCPVLLQPAFIVCEAVEGASPQAEEAILWRRLLRRRAAKAWKAFKLSAVSAFTYVETAGLFFAGKIVGDTLALTRTAPDPNIDGLDRDVIGRIGPRIAPRVVDGRRTGFEDSERVAMALAALRGMSLTGSFARLVLIVGHGSRTVNNPHGSSLDCGACGGHTGEANARVAAAILNDPITRRGLLAQGVAIPGDTWFLGCLHDTTSDDVTVFDASAAPASHAADIRRLEGWLGRASALARRERAARLGLRPDARIDTGLRERGRDWSQVRPEWGLAGAAAFIAAPRPRTAGLNLNGRAFLHSYDWREDPDFSVLALILSAPMVVASWISLQYYGSTVNNRAFGAGNKALHNVVSVLGVLEGNAGDLKTGLPWQSVHDGERFVHEPVRLNVIVAAPPSAIDGVLARYQTVRDLVENRWVHLFALGEDEQPWRRYRGQGRWEAFSHGSGS